MRARRWAMSIAAAGAALSLAACGGGTQSTISATPPSSVAAIDSSEPVPESSDPVVAPDESSEAPAETGFQEVAFGGTVDITSGDRSGSAITLTTPTLAECQYESIGCDDPEVGERIVELGVTITNDSSETVEWGSDFFILEFADGTQLTPSDGAALDYWPDNHLDYEVKVRPGSTYKGVLVFEAPKGAFTVLLLDESYGGEPVAAWS